MSLQSLPRTILNFIKMSKIIIDNQSDLSDRDALVAIKDVIDRGRISNDGKQYCYLTRRE